MNSKDIYEILKYLPHRYPFLLIDRILDYEKDVSLTAIKNVTVNEPFFPAAPGRAPCPVTILPRRRLPVDTLPRGCRRWPSRRSRHASPGWRRARPRRSGSISVAGPCWP